MTDKVILFTTCGSQDEAEKIARSLVESRLAACVNILPPVRSVYRWKDQIEDAGEWMLMIKSRRALVDDLSVALRKAHSYEIPELVVTPIVDGLPEYLDWIDRETGAVGQDV